MLKCCVQVYEERQSVYVSDDADDNRPTVPMIWNGNGYFPPEEIRIRHPRTGMTRVCKLADVEDGCGTRGAAHYIVEREFYEIEELDK